MGFVDLIKARTKYMRNQRSITAFSVLLAATFLSFPTNALAQNAQPTPQTITTTEKPVELTAETEEKTTPAVPLMPAAEQSAQTGATSTTTITAPSTANTSSPTDANAQPGTNLPVPNFLQDDPAMTLDPNEAIGAGTTTDPNYDAAKTAEQMEEQKREEAFKAALQGLLPLRPEEIRELLEHFDRTQESVELPVYPSPKPEIAVETVSLDPGVKPVTVKVAYGNVTTLNFLDISGSPWPIEDISWAGNFEVIDSSSQNGAHTLRITPQSEFATGNMSIRMLGLKTPVIVSLETSREIVHYRFDAIIPEYGPLAETPLIDKGLTIEAGDDSIASVLQGVVPPSATKLSVSGVDGRTSAYRISGLTYVRTPLTLLSPSWSSSVASADGMRVYAIKSAPVLLLSDKGKMVRARLSDRENLLEDVSDDR